MSATLSTTHPSVTGITSVKARWSISHVPHCALLCGGGKLRGMGGGRAYSRQTRGCLRQCRPSGGPARRAGIKMHAHRSVDIDSIGLRLPSPALADTSTTSLVWSTSLPTARTPKSVTSCFPASLPARAANGCGGVWKAGRAPWVLGGGGVVWKTPLPLPRPAQTIDDGPGAW